VDLMRQILSALEAAHAIGVIHRDLKPANVMVTAEGRAKLLDFGLAKILPGADSELGTGSQLTLDGMVMGTLPYLAPEQLQASDVRRRSDLFSLGVLTYELLTGETPFPGSTMVEYARAILTRPAQPPSDHRPDVPEWLDELVLSLLAIEPEERPSAAEIRNDLDRRIGPVPTASPPTASPTSEPVEKAPEPEGMSTTGAGTKEADSGVAPVADSPSPAAAAATAAAAAAATATGPATALAARRESSAAGPVLPPEVSEAREMAPSQMTPSQMDGVAGGRGPGNLVAATADEVSSHGSATWPLVEDLHGLGTWQKALWILSLLALAAVLTARFGLL
jgi:serine/threonine-protein kinase